MKRHLLSAARPHAATTRCCVLDTAEELARLADRADQEAADPARPHRRQPLLRGLDPHPDLLRGGRQAAVGRRHQLLRQGLERLQGREPQGHRADAGGDGRRRRRRPAPRQRRAAPARALRLDRRRRRQRRRRHARAPDAGAARRVHDAAPPGRRRRRPGRPARDHRRRRPAQPGRPLQRPAAAHARRRGHAGRAADPAPGRRRRPGRARSPTTSTRALPKSRRGDDAAGPARADERRAFFPSAARVRAPLRPGRDPAASAARPRDRHAPRPDEPRHGDRGRRRRRRPLDHRRAGHQRRERADGGPLPAARRSAIRDRPGAIRE